MNNKIQGLHHITAIAGEAKRNADFYTRILGLRMVKKTVNFDDPHTYHLYYGNEQGSPGTILTFFPWQHVKPGANGTGMATEIGYSVPEGSLEFWSARFAEQQVKAGAVSTRFGEPGIDFSDPDGLQIRLSVSKTADERKPWTTAEIGAEVGVKGFHNIVLTLRDIKATAAILTDIFGYRLLEQEGNRYRYITDEVQGAALVDLVEVADGKPGINAGGTNHHVAFRVQDEQTLMMFREKVAAYGLNITGKIDRNYFFSLYFREPGGVLFEIATDNPGFTVDEPLAELGTHLRLPEQYESSRARIEQSLPVIG